MAPPAHCNKPVHKSVLAKNTPVTFYFPSIFSALRYRFFLYQKGLRGVLPRVVALETPEDLMQEWHQLCGIQTPLPMVEPVVSQGKRLGFLATLIHKKQHMVWKEQGFSQAPFLATLQLTQELVKLVDQGHVEGISFEKIHQLVPEEFSQHWQMNAEFLSILQHHWGDFLKKNGLQDVYLSYKRYAHFLEKASQEIVKEPSFLHNQTIVFAGFVRPSPLELLFFKAFLSSPHAHLVVAGMDTDLTEKEWAALPSSHPQFCFKRLLVSLDIKPWDIRTWPFPPGGLSQNTSVRYNKKVFWEKIHRPFSSSPSLPLAVAQKQPHTLTPWDCQHISYVPCDNLQEEGLVIALIVRDFFERSPQKKACIVVPSLELAEIITMALQRWNVPSHHTFDVPFSRSPVGVFLRTLAQAVSGGFSSVDLLALLKSPFLLNPSHGRATNKLLYVFEKFILRSLPKAHGWQGLALAIEATALPHKKIITAIFNAWEKKIAPLIDLMDQPSCSLESLLRAHLQSAENLSSQSLWGDSDGQEAAHFFSTLLENAAFFPAISGTEYSDIFYSFTKNHLLSRKIPSPLCPIDIIQPHQSHLQTYDLVVLAGLNEGTWPPEPSKNLWLSGSMQKDMGFCLPFEEMSYFFYDFGKNFITSTELFFTRSLKVGGAPTVPSRILSHLQSALKNEGLFLSRPCQWVQWAKELDTPPVKPYAPPRPQPPCHARPCHVFATQVETWMKNPYQFYARKILQLFPQTPLEKAPDFMEQGRLIHHILHTYTLDHPTSCPPNAKALLHHMGKVAFQALKMFPEVHLFWWPRFEKTIEWFVEVEKNKRQKNPSYRTLSEVRGRVCFFIKKKKFTLEAIADRIDVVDNKACVIDYKTGSNPPLSQVAQGRFPQLPLEAFILQEGSFSLASKIPVQEMAFWVLKGVSSNIVSVPNTHSLVLEAKKGLQNLFEVFENPETPYLSYPTPGKEWDLYQHLARSSTWQLAHE